MHTTVWGRPVTDMFEAAVRWRAAGDAVTSSGAGAGHSCRAVLRVPEAIAAQPRHGCQDGKQGPLERNGRLSQKQITGGHEHRDLQETGSAVRVQLAISRQAVERLEEHLGL